MRYRTCVVCLLLCLAAAAGLFPPPARAATVTGAITDRKDRSALGGAEVRISGMDAVGLSGEDGRFRFENVKPGTYSVTASLFGYDAAAAEGVVVAGSDATVEVELSLSRLPLFFGEITVVGEPAPLIATAELSDRDIRRQGPPDVGELLRQAPEVSAIRKGGFGLDPSVRGLAGERLNVTIEGGIKVQGGCPNRMDPPTSHVNATQLQKIEIVKGPFNVKYGPAMAGIINIATARPETGETFSVHGKAGFAYETSADAERGDARLWGGNRRVDFLVGGGTRQYDDYTDGDGNKVPSSFRVNDWTGKLGFMRVENERIEVALKGQYARDVLYPGLPMDASLDDTFIGAVEYSLRPEAGTLRQISAKAYGTTVDHVMDNFGRPTAATMRSETDADGATAGFRAEGVIELPGALALDFGGDFGRSRLDGSRTRDFVSGPMAGMHFTDIIWPDAEQSDVGVFSELRVPDLLRAESVFGLRVQRTASDAGDPDPAFVALNQGDLDQSHVTASAYGSMTWPVDPGWSLSAAFGRGVRAPSMPERFVFLLPVGPDRYDHIGNPDLSPEVNYEVDLGVRRSGARCSLGLTFFRSWLRGLISSRVAPGIPPRSPGVVGVKQFVNMESAERYGLELNGSAELGAGFDVRGSVHWMEGTALDPEDPLPEIPPLEGRLALGYEHGSGLFWAEAGARLVDDQNRISAAFAETPTPAFGLLDLRGGIDIGKNREIRFALENVLDNTYYEHLNRKSKLDGRPIPEPGRNFQIMIDMGF